MMSIDLRSVVILTGLVAFLLAFVKLFLRLSHRPPMAGPSWWAAAAAIWSVAAMLFGGRGVVPDWLSVVMANALLLLGGGLSYSGTRRFFGMSGLRPAMLLLLLGLVSVLTWFTYGDPRYNVRVAIVTAGMALVQLATAWLIWRRAAEVFATRFMVVVLLAHGVVLILRFLAAWVPLPDEALFAPSRIQTLYLAANALAIVAMGLGYVMLIAERLREQLEDAASHDSLTHVLVRRAVLAACAQELARCRRYGRKMALLMLDLDHFKEVNDQHGHQTGDRVLVRFVECITPLLRRPDQLGRYGGEEFVLLLPETSEDEAVAVAQRILARVAEPVAGLPAITVSIGVTVNRPDENDMAALLERVDRALYKAKQHGRNRIAVV